MKNKKPKLGDTRPFGCDTQVYTMRGWVTCEDWKDVQEELDKIKGLSKK